MLIMGPYHICQQIIQVMRERDVVATTSSFPTSEGCRANEYHNINRMDICKPKFDFVVLNLTSMNQDPFIPQLNGLLIQGMQPGNPDNDGYYYNTIMSNEVCLDDMLRIMYPLYEGKYVFVCIDTLESHSFPAMQNDMLMWFIQERYGYTSAYVNCLDDFFYFNPDDYKFSTMGIMNFDQDKLRSISIKESRKMGGQNGANQPVIPYGQL